MILSVKSQGINYIYNLYTSFDYKQNTNQRYQEVKCMSNYSAIGQKNQCPYPQYIKSLLDCIFLIKYLRKKSTEQRI